MSQTALERQIRSQPEELDRLATHPVRHDVVERLAQCRRIWLVGTGTSLHAAELGAAMLYEAGRGAQAIPSMHFVNWAPPVDPRDGMVLISHNAGEETAYAAAAYRQAKDAGLRVLALTRQGTELPDVVETVPKETSQTYTVSYTAVLLLLARIANALGAESLSPEAIGKVPRAVGDAAEHEGTRVTALSEPADLPPLLAQIPLTVRLQILALRFAQARGQNPDRVITGAWDDPDLWAIGPR